MALNFRRVRIGFVNLILSFLEGQDKAVKMSKDIIAYLRDVLCVDVVEFEEPVGARKQATAAWRKFNGQDVDAVILFSGTFNTGELTAEIVRNMSCPFLIWGVGELSLETKSFTGSVVGVMPAATIFKSFQRPFTSIYGVIAQKEVKESLATFVRAVRAIAYLRESAIGVIGMRPDGFQVAGYDELAIKKLFGTEIKNMSLYTLSKVVNAIDEKQVDADMKVQHEDLRHRQGVRAGRPGPLAGLPCAEKDRQGLRGAVLRARLLARVQGQRPASHVPGQRQAERGGHHGLLRVRRGRLSHHAGAARHAAGHPLVRRPGGHQGGA